MTNLELAQRQGNQAAPELLTLLTDNYYSKN